MEIAIVGGHGKIGLLLGKILVDRGDVVFGLIRSPEQEDDLHAIGVEPVLCDLEADDDLGEAVSGTEAVVFAAEVLSARNTIGATFALTSGGVPIGQAVGEV